MFEVVGHFSHGQTELWLLEKTVEMMAQLITFSWGEGEAASTPLIADFFFFFFDCGYLVRTMLTSFLSASWHLFVSKESFP